MSALATVVAGAAILLLLMASAHRLKSQWADSMLSSTEELVEPELPSITGTKLNAGVNISTFIGPDGQPYLSAADTKRLGERASKAMASRRRVKVYQPTRDTRAGTNGTVYYGQRFSAAVFDHIEFVDPPRDEHDRQWIRDHLMTRIAPAGKLRLSKEMVPHVNVGKYLEPQAPAHYFQPTEGISNDGCKSD